MKLQLETYQSEVSKHLDDLLRYWMQHATDDVNGGFAGKIDHSDKVHADAPKGSVLNSRILWSFSAAYNLTKKVQYLQAAERAYKYLTRYFIDAAHGGVYWTVDHTGEPLDTKKQIYALSFAIYGLSEYYKAVEEEDVKLTAIKLYRDIVKYSYDSRNGGYIEALTREWTEMSDLRLSAKDANERKSMNTHLHVLEGFANLYSIWPDQDLLRKIEELVIIFAQHIISPETYHLRLFFDDAWIAKGNLISYGHDIEAAWLIQDAAGILGDKELLQLVQIISVKMTDAAAEGLDKDGGLWYEFDGSKDQFIRQKHWWPQAEAMVGFFNAWQITGDEKYMEMSVRSWKFIQDHIMDKSGEWVWGVYEDYTPMIEEDKAGIWKCPYHNSRACIEIIKRIDQANYQKETM